MDERRLRISKLAMQLQTVVELDDSLGISYCNIPSGLQSLNLSDNSDVSTIHNEPVETSNRVDNPLPQNIASQTQPVVQRENYFAIPTTDTPADVTLTGSSDRVEQIMTLNSKTADCSNCVLGQSRKNAIRAEGNTDADIVFVTSAPGREEDNTGRNFQGAAGQLIIDIIEKGMKLPRSQVYFTSIVKCRPPGNRNLIDIEIESCISYFEEEMRIIAPKAIVAVGQAAANILTSQDVPIDMTRGVWYEYKGIPVMPIYHPSFLLRQRRKLGHKNQYVRNTWQDIKLVMAKVGLNQN